MLTFYESLALAVATEEPFALGIITEVRGSSPQKVGAKALFHADGRITGTMGGGCLEAEIQDRARLALVTGKPETFDLVLDHDFGWDDGLICGGRVEGVILPRVHAVAPIWRELARRAASRTWGLTEDFQIAWADEPTSAGREWCYRETVSPPSALWIAGAGHIAQAVAPLALGLDFQVTVWDDRPALANHQIFPKEVALRVGEWDKTLHEPFSAPATFGLIVTRGHRHDALVLRHWINRDFAFLGMIGSSRKARTIREHFLREKIAEEAALAQVACPVGMDIDSRTVPEIAISIIGQFIAKRAAWLKTNEPTVRP